MGPRARPAPTAGAEPGSVPYRVGRYTLYQEIASGGMGSVHFGRLSGPAGFGRTVAIKRLHPRLSSEADFVAMLADEARLASRVRHPNVVPTLDVVESDDGLLVVMEYVHGESLSRLLGASVTMGLNPPPRVILAIMTGALRGLHAAHEATSESGEPLGIIHRDVSPQNILVGADGQARVVDFGVAKAAVRLTTTRDGQLKGKLAYMAPEQLLGEEFDRRSDIYAASVVLWEALVGARLFDGRSEGELLNKILNGVKRGPSLGGRSGAKTVDQRSMDLLGRVDAIVLRGLSKDPATRYPTARQMAMELEAVTKLASVEEVEEWVLAMAGPLLAKRAETLRDIETRRDSLPPTAEARSAPPPAPSNPSSQPPAAERIPEPEPTVPTLTSDAYALVKEARSRVRPWKALAALAVLPIILVLSFVEWPRARPSAATPAVAVSPVGPPAPAVVATVEPVPVSAPASAPVPSPAVKAEATARPTAERPQAASPSPERSIAPRPAPAPAPSPKPNRMAPDCDPPYTLDNQGVRIPKQECL